MSKFLDSDAFTYVWGKLKSYFVAQETGKGLSTNDFTTAEKNKLSGIEAGAEVNAVTSVNGMTGDVIVQGGGGGDGGQYTLLWSGSASTMGATTITLSQSALNFDFLICEASYWGTGSGSSVPMRTSGITNILVANTNGNAELAKRTATVSGTSVTFTNGRWINGGSSDNSTSACIPHAIYGAKIGSSGFERAKTLLWTNPSPTADNYQSQTVTLAKDSSEYDAFIVEMYFKNAYNKTELILNDQQTHVVSTFNNPPVNGNYTIGWRAITISGNQAVIGNGNYMSNSGNNQNVWIPQPLAIYGIKFGGSNGTPLPTEYAYSMSWTDWSNAKTRTYTVSGNGFIFVSVSAKDSGDNDTGSVWIDVLQNNNQIGYSYVRLQTAGTPPIGANVAVMTVVANGDVIVARVNATKAGTATAWWRTLAFGCTLTES